MKAIEAHRSGRTTFRWTEEVRRQLKHIFLVMGYDPSRHGMSLRRFSHEVLSKLFMVQIDEDTMGIAPAGERPSSAQLRTEWRKLKQESTYAKSWPRYRPPSAEPKIATVRRLGRPSSVRSSYDGVRALSNFYVQTPMSKKLTEKLFATFNEHFLPEVLGVDRGTEFISQLPTRARRKDKTRDARRQVYEIDQTEMSVCLTDAQPPVQVTTITGPFSGSLVALNFSADKK